MTAIEKFCERVLKDHGLQLEPKTFKRLYPGYWQRKAGAWSWAINFNGRLMGAGSQFPISDLLKAPEVSFDGESFYAET